MIGTCSSAQEWQVNQLDGNPLIPVGFGRVGQLKERRLIRISEGTISGEFHGLSALRLLGHMDHGVFETVAVEGFAAGALHQRTRFLRRKPLAGLPHRILPLKADITQYSRHVSNVPTGDIDHGWRLSQRGS
jgi:hypothetical protein